jgi:hypothetical protein
MSFHEHCVLKKSVFPLLPCDEKKCSWYIHEGSCNNCFWILAHVMDKERVDFDIEEVARMEGISVEEVNAVMEGAFEKLRRLMPQMKKEEE